MMKMNTTKLLALALSVSLLAACESDPDTDLQDSIVESTETSNFDPANGVIPFPNNLLFKDMVDGTLNIPVANELDLTDPKVAMNGLDGFSTIAPITTGFTGRINEDSINGDSIKIYEVTLSSGSIPGGAAVALNKQLIYGDDFVGAVSSVDPSGASLAILPLKPLSPKTSYYVVITGSLESSDGNPMGMAGGYAFAKLTTALVDGGGVSQAPGLTDEQAVALEPLRQLVSTSEASISAADAGLETTDIILSWSFTTQSIGDVLANVLTDADITSAAIAGLINVPAPATILASDIYAGALTLPYYLAEASNVNDPTPLGSFWKGTGGTNLSYIDLSGLGALGPRLSPVATNSTLAVPVIITVPASSSGTIPVVIYIHGITRNRTDMLAVADAFASQGIAVVAIDLPMHGITGNEKDEDGNPSPIIGFKGALPERTFDLDLATEDADGNVIAAVPDGVTDSSGRHYVNLKNLLNTRDNLRQSVSDMFALTNAISGLTVGGNTLDGGAISVLGHSLGAIVGTTFSSLESNVKDTVFAFGGGSLPKILDGSAAFSPTLVAGLAASGVVKGTADFESFIGAAQTVVDSGDSVNYSTKLATDKTEGILYFEIVGGNSSPSDLVVPNTVPDGNDSSGTVPAPLAGTEPTLKLMSLTQVNSTQTGADLRHSVKFVVGNHGSLIDPKADDVNDAATNLAVTTEIQKMAVGFVLSQGGVVSVTNDTLIQVPAP